MATEGSPQAQANGTTGSGPVDSSPVKWQLLGLRQRVTAGGQMANGAAGMRAQVLRMALQ